MAFTLVNSAVSSNNGSGASLGVALSGAPVSAGDLVFVAASGVLSTGDTMSVSDGTTAFTPGTLLLDNGRLAIQGFYLLASVATGTPTYTVTYSTARTSRSITVYIFTPSAAANFDAENGTETIGTTAAASGNITTTSNDSLVFGSQTTESQAASSSELINAAARTAVIDSGTHHTLWYTTPNATFTGQAAATIAGGNTNIGTIIMAFRIGLAPEPIRFVTSNAVTIGTAASTWSMVTGGSSMTAGGAVVIGLGAASTTVTVSTITDNTTNVYRKAVAHSTPRSTSGAEIWYCQGYSTASTRISVALSGNSSGSFGYAHFTGFSTANALGPTGSSGITVVSSVHSAASITPSTTGVAVSFLYLGASTLGVFRAGPADWSTWASTDLAAKMLGRYQIQAAAAAVDGPSTTSSKVTHCEAIAFFYDTVVVSTGGGGFAPPVFQFCLVGIQGPYGL